MNGEVSTSKELQETSSVLGTLASLLTRWSTKWVPDAYVIAVILTLVTMLMALAWTKTTPLQVVQYWGQGFWALLTFAMQMSLIIVTGYIVAVSPPMSKLLNRLAEWPRSPRQAIFLMAAVSMVLSLLNWGLSLVGSAVFVRYIARKQKGVDYRLLVATAYLGMGTTWHAGLSASAPLLVATPGHFLEKQIGLIPLSQTIFSPFNLILVAIIVVVMAFLAPLLMPKRKDVIEVSADLLRDLKDFEPPPRPAEMSPAVWLENSPLINIVIGIFGLIWLVWYFSTKGPNVTLDVVNFTFLIIGILLHWTPASLLKAAQEGGGFVWGVILQFPFYAGIYGIINYSHLSDVIGQWFASVATAKTFPLIIYWYSGILNYFVPSGGSKWAIEAPYILSAAKSLGVSNASTVLSYAWGDMMTDVIQPFWAIPLLTVARLNFRDIMGFAIMFFIVFFIITSIAFFAFA